MACILDTERWLFYAPRTPFTTITLLDEDMMYDLGQSISLGVDTSYTV